MNPQDDAPAPAASPTPSPAAPTVPTEAPVASAALLRPGVEQSLEGLARALLQDRRSERRWRVFFRLAWLGLVAVVVWALFAQRGHSGAPTGPHTALVEVRGEIAADTEASAEQLIAGLRAGGHPHQQPGWQPCAGRHRQ